MKTLAASEQSNTLVIKIQVKRGDACLTVIAI